MPGITLGCDELGRVDEWSRRQERGVVDASEHDGDGVKLERVVGLLRDVVGADRILETDVKPDKNRY